MQPDHNGAQRGTREQRRYRSANPQRGTRKQARYRSTNPQLAHTDTRQQRHLHLHHPTYPQEPTHSAPQSAASSIFQSSGSLASLSSTNTSSAQAMQAQPGFCSAPMPSPSSTQPMQYFAAPTSHPSQQAQQQAHGLPIPQPTDGAFVGQRGDGGGSTSETAPFAKDFNLVAEAAERAQMACLLRDLDEVEL